jgi:hypothetical protein
MRSCISSRFYAVVAVMLAIAASGSAAQTRPSTQVCGVPDIAATKARFERDLQSQKAVLARLAPSQKDEIRLVERGIDAIGREIELWSSETDPTIALYKGEMISADYLADACRSRLEKGDPFIEDLERRSKAQRRLEVMEETRNSPDERENRLNELDQQRGRDFHAECVQRYDRTHPPDANLRELSDSEKILRGEPERIQEQLDRAKRAKRSVEQLLAWDEKHGLTDSIERRFLKTELLNCDKIIEFSEAAKSDPALNPPKFSPKPATFPSSTDFRP